MASNTFPDDWRDKPCFVAVIPEPLVPFVGGLLTILEKRGFWASEGDYSRAYTATVELEACLMATCLNDLRSDIHNLYRLLDTALMGTEYEGSTTDETDVTPAIPTYKPYPANNGLGLVPHSARMIDLVDNSINGTETGLYDYEPSVKALLQGIIDAVTASGDDSDLLEQLIQIVALLG